MTRWGTPAVMKLQADIDAATANAASCHWAAGMHGALGDQGRADAYRRAAERYDAQAAALTQQLPGGAVRGAQSAAARA